MTTAEAAEGSAEPESAAAGARRSDPWKVAFAALLVVGLLAVVVWLLLGSRLLVVRQIEVAGSDRTAEEDVAAAADVVTGTPLARVDIDAAEESVEELRLVETARVRRNWPATLRVEITERTPVLSVRADDGYQLVDPDGVRIEDSGGRPDGHPVVAVRGEVEGNPGIAAAAEITSALPGSVLDELDYIDAADLDEVTLELAGGARVAWGDTQRSEEKARVFEVLMGEHPATPEREYDVSAPDVAVVR